MTSRMLTRFVPAGNEP